MRKLMFIVVLIVLLGVVLDVNVAAAPSPAECHEERRLAVNACKPVLYGKLPTPQCCERARVSHTECICPDVTRVLIAIIGDTNRAIRLIERCGRRVPRNFKCGSFTTPP